MHGIAASHASKLAIGFEATALKKVNDERRKR